MKNELAQSPELIAALDHLPNQSQQVIEMSIAIQQIAAPTMAEGDRAAFVETQFRRLDLADIVQDEGTP